MNRHRSARSTLIEDAQTVEENRQLKLEMADLKAQIKVDQQLIAGISSNEMVRMR